MKSFFKYILFLILLNVGLVAKSETIYPIQLYATMLPPYTNCISDYITDGMHRMKLTAVVRDMNNHSFNQVRVLIQVKMGDKIKYEATTYPAVLGQAKMMHDISVTALNNIIVGDGKKGGCLEEGSYEFVFQVFDAHNSSLPLSEPVSIYCYLDEPEPPVCIYPKDGDCIKDGGVINFTWMDAVASNLSSKEYKFELLEDITPEPSNSDLLPMFGDKDIAGKKGILERTIYNSNVYTLNYAGQLQTGRKYYWRVTNVTDASKANYTNGANKYSELSSFTFGDCNPATPEEVKKEVEELSEKLEIKSVDTDSKSVSATITWGLEGSDDVEALKKFCKYKLYFTRKKNSNESVDATASESNEENQESETDDNKPDEDSNVKSVDDIEDEFVVEVGNVNTYTITSVERTQIYNVRVEGITCDENKEISGKTDKSEPKDFMIPQLESEECNSNIKEVECQSLATLEKGASFFANDDNVVVKVTELDQSKSNDETHVYSGKGIVTCTIFKEKLGLNVEFKNIKVNKDNHLCDGVVEVVSSEENNLMVNLNDVAGKGRTASKAPEQKEVKNVENKEEITDPKKNQEHRNNVVTNGSTLYAVNNTGGSESVGTLVNDVTPSTSSLDNEDGVVMFDVEKNLENNSWTPYIDMGAYPFLNTSIVRDYERMGGSYIVPWLAMESGDFKWIKAKPTLKDNKDIKRFDELNFYAKIGENYYQLDSKKIENGNSFDYNVKVFGADANKSYSIYAMSKDKSKTFGRLKVYSMKNKEIKVKLVPVINKVEFENSLTDFQDRLNKIFEPLAKKFIFNMDDKPFTDGDIKETVDDQHDLSFLNDGLNTTEGNGIFANETKEMKLLRKLYQKNTSDDNSYDAYLFLIPKNTESEIKGFMPRTYSVGYLFVGESGNSNAVQYNDIYTAAHELCHGVFGLQHTFDYQGVVKGGVEENLMDYSTADIFRYPSKYFQWYNIENPSDYHFPFVDTPEDGENLLATGMKKFAKSTAKTLSRGFITAKAENHDLEVSQYFKDTYYTNGKINYGNLLGTAGDIAKDMADGTKMEDVVSQFFNTASVLNAVCYECIRQKEITYSQCICENLVETYLLDFVKSFFDFSKNQKDREAERNGIALALYFILSKDIADEMLDIYAVQYVVEDKFDDLVKALLCEKLPNEIYKEFNYMPKEAIDAFVRQEISKKTGCPENVLYIHLETAKKDAPKITLHSLPPFMQHEENTTEVQTLLKCFGSNLDIIEDVKDEFWENETLTKDKMIPNQPYLVSFRKLPKLEQTFSINGGMNKKWVDSGVRAYEIKMIIGCSDELLSGSVRIECVLESGKKVLDSSNNSNLSFRCGDPTFFPCPGQKLEEEHKKKTTPTVSFSCKDIPGLPKNSKLKKNKDGKYVIICSDLDKKEYTFEAVIENYKVVGVKGFMPDDASYIDCNGELVTNITPKNILDIFTKVCNVWMSIKGNEKPYSEAYKKGEDKKARLIKEYNRLDQLNDYLNVNFDFLWNNQASLIINGKTNTQCTPATWRKNTFCNYPKADGSETDPDGIYLDNINKVEYTKVINEAMSFEGGNKERIIAALIATAEYFSTLRPTEDVSLYCQECVGDIDYAKDFENKWVARCKQRYNLWKENYEINGDIDIKCACDPKNNKEKLQFSEEAEREEARKYFDKKIEKDKYGSVDNFLSEFMIKMYTKFMNKDGGAYGKVQSIIGNFSVTTDSYYSYPDCFIRLQSKDK